MKPIALTLLLALTAHAEPDAGTPISTQLPLIYAVCPDAPLLEPVDGGYFMATQRAERLRCMQKGCEAYANRLEQRLNANDEASPLNPAPADASLQTAQLVTIGAVIVFVLGVGTGYVLREKVAR